MPMLPLNHRQTSPPWGDRMASHARTAALNWAHVLLGSEQHERGDVQNHHVFYISFLHISTVNKLIEDGGHCHVSLLRSHLPVAVSRYEGRD